jgi:hypothetical protein
MHGVNFTAAEDVYYTLDVARAEAYDPRDRNRILAAISDTVGFERMNIALKDGLVASTARSAAQAGPLLASTDPEMRNQGKVAVYNHLQMMRISGDFNGAALQAARILASDEEALGPQHPDTATSINNLAGLLASQGASVHLAAAALP